MNTQAGSRRDNVITTADDYFTVSFLKTSFYFRVAETRAIFGGQFYSHFYCSVAYLELVERTAFLLYPTSYKPAYEKRAFQ